LHISNLIQLKVVSTLANYKNFILICLFFICLYVEIYCIKVRKCTLVQMYTLVIRAGTSVFLAEVFDVFLSNSTSFFVVFVEVFCCYRFSSPSPHPPIFSLPSDTRSIVGRYANPIPSCQYIPGLYGDRWCCAARRPLRELR
jgi:hypothetical protein